MSKEETPITAEEFIKSKNVEFYLQDETMDIICNLMEQYAQAKVEELQKENDRINGLLITQNRLFNKCNQIIQLQKEIQSLKNKKEG